MSEISVEEVLQTIREFEEELTETKREFFLHMTPEEDEETRALVEKITYKTEFIFPSIMRESMDDAFQGVLPGWIHFNKYVDKAVVVWDRADLLPKLSMAMPPLGERH